VDAGTRGASERAGTAAADFRNDRRDRGTGEECTLTGGITLNFAANGSAPASAR
jgi:hypothetical protein